MDLALDVEEALSKTMVSLPSFLTTFAKLVGSLLGSVSVSP